MAADPSVPDRHLWLQPQGVDAGVASGGAPAMPHQQFHDGLEQRKGLTVSMFGPEITVLYAIKACLCQNGISYFQIFFT